MGKVVIEINDVGEDWEIREYLDAIDDAREWILTERAKHEVAHWKRFISYCNTGRYPTW